MFFSSASVRLNHSDNAKQSNSGLEITPVNANRPSKNWSLDQVIKKLPF